MRTSSKIQESQISVLDLSVENKKTSLKKVNKDIETLEKLNYSKYIKISDNDKLFIDKIKDFTCEINKYQTIRIAEDENERSWTNDGSSYVRNMNARDNLNKRICDLKCRRSQIKMEQLLEEKDYDSECYALYQKIDKLKEERRMLLLGIENESKKIT